MAAKRAADVRVKRPSDIEYLGSTIAALSKVDGDALHALADTLPVQISHVLRHRGVSDQEIHDITVAADKWLEQAGSAHDSLIWAGEGLQRVADAIVTALRVRQAKPVEVNGYSITGT